MSRSSDEDAVFECGVCLIDVRTCTGAIWQCPEGHILCSLCFGKIGGSDAPCPSCRMIMGSFRCRVVEKQRDHQLQRAANALAGAAKHAQDEKRHEDDALAIREDVYAAEHCESVHRRKRKAKASRAPFDAREDKKKAAATTAAAETQQSKEAQLKRKQVGVNERLVQEEREFDDARLRREWGPRQLADAVASLRAFTGAAIALPGTILNTFGVGELSLGVPGAIIRAIRPHRRRRRHWYEGVKWGNAASLAVVIVLAIFMATGGIASRASECNPGDIAMQVLSLRVNEQRERQRCKLALAKANTHRKPVFEGLRTSPPPAMCVTWMKNLDLVGDIYDITNVCSKQELRQEVVPTLDDLLPHGSAAAIVSVSKHASARSIADLLSGGITLLIKIMANPALRSGDKAMQRKLKAMWNFRVVDLGEQNRLEAEFESLGYCGVCTLQPGDTLPPSRSRPPPQRTEEET